MLNPTENLHRKFMDLNGQQVGLFELYLRKEATEAEALSKFLALQTQLFDLSGDILKAEWERVKRGE